MHVSGNNLCSDLLQTMFNAQPCISMTAEPCAGMRLTIAAHIRNQHTRLATTPGSAALVCLRSTREQLCSTGTQDRLHGRSTPCTPLPDVRHPLHAAAAALGDIQHLNRTRNKRVIAQLRERLQLSTVHAVLKWASLQSEACLRQLNSALSNKRRGILESSRKGQPEL